MKKLLNSLLTFILSLLITITLCKAVNEEMENSSNSIKCSILLYSEEAKIYRRLTFSLS